MAESDLNKVAAQQEYKELLASANILEGEQIKPLLKSFLDRYPDHPPALRLQGLLLEHEISEDVAQGFDVPSYDSRMEKMRRSFEAALQSDPRYVLALIDLGDYWKDYGGDCEQAIQWYDRAIELLKGGHFTENHSEEIKDAYARKIDALIELGQIDEANNCRRCAMNDCQEDDYFKNLQI